MVKQLDPTQFTPMEQTLLTIFDELDSTDNATVSTGLSRLDQLLADICLPSQMDHANYTISSVRQSRSKHTNKNISILLNDPAYIEIIELQDSFQYNVATRVMACLVRLTTAVDESKLSPRVAPV